MCEAVEGKHHKGIVVKKITADVLYTCTACTEEHKLVSIERKRYVYEIFIGAILLYLCESHKAELIKGLDWKQRRQDDKKD